MARSSSVDFCPYPHLAAENFMNDFSRGATNQISIKHSTIYTINADFRHDIVVDASEVPRELPIPRDL
jgi:hypothetical protein